MDQSILESLSMPQRQKVTRQLRKEQVKKYLEFVKLEREKHGSLKRERRENKKKTKVEFGETLLLQDAVENFDDREVARLLRRGANKNFRTGNDTSLLHKCVEEENFSTAEMLIREGVDVNAMDIDGWTPLHMACHCQAVEMVQLLLNNGADITKLDMDGFFPMDHAPEDSDTRELMLKHMQGLGVNEKHLEGIRLKIPREMFNNVKDHLSQGGSPNKGNEDGVTLLHIACANGYRKVIRLLLKHGADVNQADSYGWTSLHIASKFNQMRIVQTLLKSGADPLRMDSNNCTPSQVSTNDNIRALLTKAERKQKKKLSWRDSELPDNLGDDDDTEAEDETGYLVRINSKNVRSRHTTLAKEDELMEARQREENQRRTKGSEEQMEKDTRTDYHDDKQSADDIYEEIYISKIWRNVNEAKAQLPTQMDSDNLADLADISESAILREIQTRFTGGQIYTYIGDMLIAVNPFQDLQMYSKEVSQKYHSKSYVPLPPHVYGVAERAHKCLLSTNSSQCCVISGESGAGKTETCKYLVQHLVCIAGSEESNLNSKISQVNPLLEAFGNAKTVVNSNSSRFAKFMQLSFNGKGKIVGANLTEFLLEKSRVVSQGEGELNFHIFYWMFSGISLEEANLYQLQDISKHRYLSQEGMDTKSLINTANKEKFWELKQCLQYVGFTTDDIQNILQLLATLLHLGDVTFGSQGNHDAAVVTSHEKLELVSGMLEVSSEELGSALVADFTVTRGEQIRKDRTKQQAGDCREALAKTLYSRLFSWIVNGVNQMIQPIDPSGDQFQIGILDIFGFENFTRNSFEQICINLANEQMQSYTNEYIFMKEQEDCLLEGVPLVEMNYKNNQPIIDAFLEKNLGILAIIDEESWFPKGTDFSLATKLHQGPGAKFPEVYKTPKDKGARFTIIHYAGVVQYDLVGVLKKNRDTMPNAILCTMKTSNSLLVKELFQSRVTRTGSLAPSARQQRSRKSRQSPFDFFKKLKGGRSKKKPITPVVSYERKGPTTMAYHFKNSLSDLMAKIQTATPHIIRCIRPNIERKPLVFIPEYVLAQMRYTGITETIKIKKYGYASRVKFRDFLVVYETLRYFVVPPFCMIPDEQKCREVIKFCGLSTDADSHKVGKSKVFFHETDMKKIDQVSSEVKKKVVVCQSAVRRFLAKRRYAELHKISMEQNERKVQELCHQMSLQHDKVTSWIQYSRDHDEGRVHQAQKSTEQTDISGSLDSLDDILSQYDRVPGKESDDTEDDSEEDTTYADIANVMSDMSVQHRRGLPPPPCGAFISPDSPPPNPREMYSQSGIYDVIPGEKATRRPPPPKRSSSTRLSSGRDRVSTSSDDPVFLDDPHRSANRHSPHQSPKLSRSPKQHHAQVRRSSSPAPAIPSPNQARPFSYVSALPSSPQQSNEHLDLTSPGSPTYEPIKQSYPQNGHHGDGQRRKSSNLDVRTVQPSHNAPYQRPSTGGSPNSPRRQSMPIRPVTPPQHLRDTNFPQHVKPFVPAQLDVMHEQEPMGPSVKKHRPPSFPAPPNPLSGSIKAHGSMRSPSPPLPPPPLEMGSGQQVSGQHFGNRQVSGSEPPTPPPISKIPGNRSSVTSFELGKKMREGSVDLSPLNSPTHHSSFASQLNKVQLKAAGAPPAEQEKETLKHVAMGIAAELGKVQLRSSPKDVPKSSMPQGSKETSPEALLVKLNPVKATGGSKTTPESETETGVKFVAKLKSTGGPKPWEKDTSPPSNFADAGMNVMTSSLDDEPLPPPPYEEEPLTELPLPPPPPEDNELNQPLTPVVMETPSIAAGKENLNKRKMFEKEKKDTGDNMDIDLDEIDYSQIPGYVPITNAVPNWKKDMIIKKNEEKVREYVEELRRKKAEELKWKDVPEWKRKMLEKKEKEKREQEEVMTQAMLNKEKAKTSKQRDEEERKRQDKRRQMEMQAQMEKELADVPEWKREIMLKKGAAPSNWGDEREDINRDEEGNENHE
ncbi:unconventional myosin-XVI-like isoform X5 [Ostrea edulis]|uniref:unconventional myosin-XVI-like isoform X5 n=1 Tax=Ostrea edulis TaxID=37623 RepID=UPI0024AF6260|nr:unconventional myosin-XVI-like isoform X5 [Ostrea edulis]